MKIANQINWLRYVADVGFTENSVELVCQKSISGIPQHPDIHKRTKKIEPTSTKWQNYHQKARPNLKNSEKAGQMWEQKNTMEANHPKPSMTPKSRILS